MTAIEAVEQIVVIPLTKLAIATKGVEWLKYCIKCVKLPFGEKVRGNCFLIKYSTRSLPLRQQRHIVNYIASIFASVVYYHD